MIIRVFNVYIIQYDYIVVLVNFYFHSRILQYINISLIKYIYQYN